MIFVSYLCAHLPCSFSYLYYVSNSNLVTCISLSHSFQLLTPALEGVHVAAFSASSSAVTNKSISHHNKGSGVSAWSGAVVDLMGAGTSVHDNERNGLFAYHDGSTINVYQPCVLNDMSHGNKGQNISEGNSGHVQQKDSKK